MEFGKIYIGLLAVIITSFAANIEPQYLNVTKVVDGDTIYFKDNIKCRLAFIDTPESMKNDKAKKDIRNCSGITLENLVDAGLKSKAYTGEFFKVGSSYKIYILGEDHYGRLVCYSEQFNKKIVEEGYALPFYEFIPESKKREYTAALNNSKINNSGLWKSHPSLMQCLNKSDD